MLSIGRETDRKHGILRVSLHYYATLLYGQSILSWVPSDWMCGEVHRHLPICEESHRTYPLLQQQPCFFPYRQPPDPWMLRVRCSCSFYTRESETVHFSNNTHTEVQMKRRAVQQTGKCLLKQIIAELENTISCFMSIARYRTALHHAS